MARAITYLYPNETNPSAMKVFQDRSSQIRGFYFKRDYLREISDQQFANNYAVYFLFNEEINDDGLKTIYIGQSRQGARRILDHSKNKDFWTYCIMFVSDSNVFDANAIDYMEYHFINLLKSSSSYLLDNAEPRNRKPTLSIFDVTTYDTYISQIEFLLKAEGINLIEQDKKTTVKYYEPKSKNYEAKVYFQEGKFIVEKNSFIKPPNESLREWYDQGKKYNFFKERIETLLKEEKIESQGNRYRTLVKMPFTSVSAAAEFISSSSENGWDFFRGIKELRNK